MNRFSTLIISGLIAASISGCSTPAENGPTNLYNVEDKYPIRVEPQVATLVVHVDVDALGIMRGDDARVHAFAEKWKSRGHGMLSASVPSGSASQKAAKAAMNQIIRLLAENGIAKGSLRISSFGGAGQDDAAPITLSFITDVASAADCGQDWSENMGFSPRNLPWPEFGCSTQHNLAAMVSDPTDFDGRRALDSADAMRRSTVLQKYREGVPTQTSTTEADSGTVSDIKQ